MCKGREAYTCYLDIWRQITKESGKTNENVYLWWGENEDKVGKDGHFLPKAL